MIEEYEEERDYVHILQLGLIHGGTTYVKELILLLDSSNTDVWVEYDTKGFRCFVLTHNSISINFSLVYVTDRDNKYTISTYRLMKELYRERTKDIFSTITTNYEVFKKFAKVNNGYLIDNILYFPKEKE